MKNFRSLIAVLTIVFGFAGVGCKASKPSSSPEASPAVAKPSVVNLAIWTNYVTPELLAEFEKQTGLKVQVSNYSSNEELLAKLQAGAEGYDVAVPSDYMVLAMKSLQLLHDLDLAKISHAKELSPKVLKQYYDPANQVSLPFSWGTTGIAYNQKQVKNPPKGWSDLLSRADLSGKFTLLDDVRETLGAALRAQGLGANTHEKSDIEKAKNYLLDAKKRVKGFTSETLAGLVNGEMAAAQAFSIDALLAAQKTQGGIRYLIPAEGCTLWVDNLVIPKGSRNLEGAHQLINFLLSAEVGAARAKTLFSAPANQKAVGLLSPELQANAGLFPSEQALKKCSMLEDLGEALALWDRAWTEVKAAR